MTVILLTLSLCIAIETPTKGGGGCSRVTVSPTAEIAVASRLLSSYNLSLANRMGVWGGCCGVWEGCRGAG